MLKKLILVYVFIFSYAGAILHSIVPHHHHSSQQEAKEHHHHDHLSKHSHGEDHQDDKDRDQESSPYLFTHSANTDVLGNHAYVDTVVKSKKAVKLFSIHADPPVLNLTIAKQVFHPPSDDLITNSSAYLFGALRAPPISLI